MDTQDKLINFAHNLADNKLEDVTSQLIADYKYELVNKDLEDHNYQHAYLGWLTLKDIYEISDLSSGMYGADYEALSEFGDGEYVSDDELADDLDRIFEENDVHVYKVDPATIKDIQGYFMDLGLDYFELNSALKHDSLLKDYYIVAYHDLKNEDTDFSLITDLNRTLFMGNDTYDSIHQPMFNHCSMYVYYQMTYEQKENK